MHDASTSPGIRRLRAMAVGGSLPPPGSLEAAVGALGFIQYDPIRRPARAQDLILHQRVEGYRAGDLDRAYPRLELEEDLLYAYGALGRELALLLHPRPDRARPGRKYRPPALARAVLALLLERGPLHTRDVAAHFGRGRAVNDWGGFSARTTRALEELHYHGLVRVSRREAGVKVYEARRRPDQELSRKERLRRLTLHIAHMLAPIPEPSLRGTLLQLDRASGGLDARDADLSGLLRSGALESETVDGVRYLWPGGLRVPEPAGEEPQVRFLAPFDPVVWDRRRFQHLWGWTYRLEAYTPKEKRRFGYYALPLLWGERAVGWVNYTAPPDPRAVEPGLIDPGVECPSFRAALEREVARMEAMVG